MSPILLYELFDLENGYSSTNISNLKTKKISEEFVAYIRPSKNFSNVVAGYVNKEEIPEKFIYGEGTIFVSTNGQGSHTYSYVSSFPFVPNSDVSVLIPKKPMSLNEKIFYAMCITKNRYKFSYGRKPKGNRLLNINLPSQVPEWVNHKKLSNVANATKSLVNQPAPPLEINKWKEFYYTDLFQTSNGNTTITTRDAKKEKGTVNFVTATTYNNGVFTKINRAPEYEGNMITLAKDGQGSVGEAFYQSEPFCASSHVMVLKPRFGMNVYIAMFLVTLIRRDRFKFSFGRAWSLERMKSCKLKLPVTEHGEPDWWFIEEYIKRLKYSNKIM